MFRSWEGGSSAAPARSSMSASFPLLVLLLVHWSRTLPAERITATLC